MKMKEKVESILGGFFERNKDYSVNIYVRNGITGNIIADLLIPLDRNIELKEDKVLLKGNIGGVKCCNNFSLPYDEILDCYEERDEYISQTVHVIMKNGMKFEFECCGERL